MSWGKHIFDIDVEERLLYWALLWVVGPTGDRPVDYIIKNILVEGGHAGGDPGWEIEHIKNSEGHSEFYVWTDPSISGFEPCERNYSEAVTMRAIEKSLLEYAKAYPDRTSEVNSVLRGYDFK
jgi:hypothetical protein